MYSLSPVFAAVRALNVQEEHSILAGLLIGFIMVIYEKILFSSLALNRKFILNMLSRRKLFKSYFGQNFFTQLKNRSELSALSAECNRALNVRSLHHVHVK